MTQIEYTDRYGGRPPSWLRGCHGDCEATGYVPVAFAVHNDDPGAVCVDAEADPRYVEQWQAAHAQHDDKDCDGWHFVPCPDCNGTGRVPMRESLRRIPRWFVKGLVFFRGTWNYPGPLPKQRRLAFIWLQVKCAWLYDLGWPQ